MKLEQRLIPILKGVQAAQGWNKVQLAQEIGVHESLIRQLYSRKRGIGVDFLSRIARRFPTLRNDIWEALIDCGGEKSDAA